MNRPHCQGNIVLSEIILTKCTECNKMPKVNGTIMKGTKESNTTVFGIICNKKQGKK